MASLTAYETALMASLTAYETACMQCPLGVLCCKMPTVYQPRLLNHNTLTISYL